MGKALRSRRVFSLGPWGCFFSEVLVSIEADWNQEHRHGDRPASRGVDYNRHVLRNVSGQELVYKALHSSPVIWKLIVRGAAGSLTVHVNNYLMFKCGAWDKCSDVSIDVRGSKGIVCALSS
jgi:hypothetical protein